MIRNNRKFIIASDEDNKTCHEKIKKKKLPRDFEIESEDQRFENLLNETGIHQVILNTALKKE